MEMLLTLVISIASGLGLNISNGHDDRDQLNGQTQVTTPATDNSLDGLILENDTVG